jgi:hypothetical protein
MTTEKWAREIDLLTDSFKREFGTLTATRLDWKPNANTWSIAQNMDHLIVINKTYYPVIRELREKKIKLPWIAKVSFLVRLLGNFILSSVQPDRKRKMKTFPVWEPGTSNLGNDILTRFENHQNDLKELIRKSSDLLEQRAVIYSPANRNIVYTLEAAFDIIVAHEKRHLEQAREVLHLLPEVVR